MACLSVIRAASCAGNGPKRGLEPAAQAKKNSALYGRCSETIYSAGSAGEAPGISGGNA